MLEGERRAADPGRPRLDGDDLAVEGRRAVGDAGLGEDQALGALRPERDRLAGHVGPVPDPGDLAVGQVHGVVDVAHRVGVGEADGDVDAVRERPGQVARVRLLTSSRAGAGASPECTGRRASKPRSRSELATTATDDSAMAPAASAGLRVIPNAG